MPKIEKARFWTGVLYPENMREDWELNIGDVIQYPYAYCKHTRDRDSKSEHRKDHVHLIIAFPNTTTYKHALDVMSLLSAEGKKAINKCEAVIGIRNVYDYLIHDTETCRNQGKEQYDPAERITGNNFDIGAYEQLSTAEKNEMFLELSNAINDRSIFNYMDFYEYVVNTYEDMSYVEVMRCYSGHFQRMCDGNYQRLQQGRLRGAEPYFTISQAQQHENTAENAPSQAQRVDENCPKSCPFCGSISIRKYGKTLANAQRFQCKDCGRTFT